MTKHEFVFKKQISQAHKMVIFSISANAGIKTSTHKMEPARTSGGLFKNSIAIEVLQIFVIFARIPEHHAVLTESRLHIN